MLLYQRLILLQKRLYEIINPAVKDDLASRVCDIGLMALISINVIAVILESVDTIANKLGPIFSIFEMISVIIFTIEYAIRVWTCTVNAKFSSPLIGRIRFIFTFLSLVDLFAILPFYAPLLIPFDLRFLRAIRLIRLFRIFKFARYVEAMQTIIRVFNSKKHELAITALTVMLLLIISSSIMYFVEGKAQPDVFSSIPAAMWWGVVTLTTVGYGDIYPVTLVGKLMAAFIAILGIGLFALPAGILGSGFVDEVQRAKNKDITCPHCGGKIER